jgi:hypothetical protein
MLGYDVEIFEANGEKTISTSYPNIYILLACTSMYRVTGKDGIGELEIRVNAGTYQYIPVHTSTYQYIPGHTNTY